MMTCFFRFQEAWSGKYLYVANIKPRLQLEPAVRLHRDGDCK